VAAKPSVAACLLAALLAGPALAGVEEGIAAYRQGSLKAALKELKPAAETGNAEAQYYLGRVFYYGGKGFPSDYGRAAAWFLKAAEQGHAAAQYKIGGSYFSGRGVLKDPVAAVAWWRRAADQGHAEAQNNLGALYANGVGVPRDLVAAYALQELARIGGNELAEDNLKAKAALMSEAELQAAKALAARMNQPGGFATALDRHLLRLEP
jgi:TPR repeat protein